MATKDQDSTAQHATPQPRGRCAGMVAGKRGAAAGKTTAGRARPILGESEAVCRSVVENAFGKRHWAAPWALALCEADPQFLTHLAEQPRGYAHFLCLVRMVLLKRGASGDARDEARMLQAGNKRELLKELFPSCPADIINLLPKLPNKPLSEEEYRWLIDALADNKIRKHFMHIKRIKKFDLLLASDALHFPASFRAAAMRGIKDEDEYENFLRVMHAANRLDLNIAEREIVRAVDQLEARDWEDWLMGKVAERPFSAAAVGRRRQGAACSLARRTKKRGQEIQQLPGRQPQSKTVCVPRRGWFHLLLCVRPHAGAGGSGARDFLGLAH